MKEGGAGRKGNRRLQFMGKGQEIMRARVIRGKKGNRANIIIVYYGFAGADGNGLFNF